MFLNTVRCRIIVKGVLTIQSLRTENNKKKLFKQNVISKVEFCDKGKDAQV